MITDLQMDVLIEIMNTHIGKAASLLAEMVNQRVLLSVPELDLNKGKELDFIKNESCQVEFETSILSLVRFGGEFSGNAYLVFPAGRAKDLVLACTQSETNDTDEEYGKITMEDFDVIREISNIIFNAIIGEFGELLDVKLEYTLPEVRMTVIDKAGRAVIPEDISFIALYTSFTLSKSQIKGMLFISLSVDSEKMLIDKINKMLVDVNE